MNKKQREFRKQYRVPLSPIMPRKYDAKQREELKEFEKKILSSVDKEEFIGKEPGE